MSETKEMSIIFIGHFAIDRVITRNLKKVQPSLGGSVSYCSLSLSKYIDDVNIHIVSNLGKSNLNKEILTPIKKNDINLEGVNWIDTKNTEFTLEYRNHSRLLTLNSKSPDLSFDLVPKQYLSKNIDAIVLVPLCNEISIQFIKKILNNFPNAYIGMDLQGFIRKIEENGKVLLVHDKKTKEKVEQIVNMIGSRLILKGSEEEMKILSEKEDLIEVMNYFQKFQGLYIMTLGEKGSMITRKNKGILKIPAYKSNNVLDETGAGDVYLSIFIYEFLKSNKTWESIRKSALLASAAASFEIEKKGTYGFQSKKRIIKRVNSKKYTF